MEMAIKRRTILSVLQIVAILNISLIVACANNCKSSFFSLVQRDHRLNSGVIQEFRLQSEVECFQQCFGHSQCKAVNIFNELDSMNISRFTRDAINGLFRIRHYGGRWLRLDTSSGNFILSETSPDYFSYTASKSVLHIDSGKCMQPVSSSSNAKIKLTNDCGTNSKFESTSRNSMKHAPTGKCIHPLNGYARPSEGTPIIIHSGCGQKRLQFFIEQENFIKCQLLANTKKEKPPSEFVCAENWKYYQPA